MSLMVKYKTIIIGSGIAGSTLAYELNKRNGEYLILTDKKNPLCNTTSLSYGHFRVPDKNFKEGCLNVGIRYEKINQIESNKEMVVDFLDELDLEYKEKSFGLIVNSKNKNVRGGLVLLSRIQKDLEIETKNLVHSFKETQKGITLYTSNGIYDCENLVLAIGGMGGSFSRTNNVRYSSYGLHKNYEIYQRNNGSLFYHPFGINQGRDILIGSDVSNGEFINSENKPIFSGKFRNEIKNDDYHENFQDILDVINNLYSYGEKVFFSDSNSKIEIFPTVHYTNGGFDTNLESKIKGFNNIYSIGECEVDGNLRNGRLPGYALTKSVINAKLLGYKL
ncbi:hypothetical protein C0585_05665 [Candidatus Woesearchaeota archaeon]|nr:MAG: hypothetical protein C0585_05665 [Candidatus Woesearchaeota archaeon]